MNELLKQILYKAIEIMKFSRQPIISRFLITALIFLITTSFGGYQEQSGQFEAKEFDSYKLKTVVIDAGHGGQDYGCNGKNSYEKNVALNIALKLGAQIQEKYPDVKVIYTRKTDVFVELYERAAIANRNKADLFICIHCNANPSTSPYGTETYVMGLHKTEANLNVAKRENDVILMEDDYDQHYDGFDPNNPASHIIFSLNQHAYMDQSILFASKVEDYFKDDAKRSSRGVKQAGFLVLWKTAMPSVLIETGFLTNTTEEKFLVSGDGQDKIAGCILRAFSDYKTIMEHPVENNSVKNEPASTTNGSSTTNASTQTDTPVLFQVQFYADETELKTTNSKFSQLQKESINYISENGLYKYRIGPYKNLDEAVKKQSIARNAGFKDAFVVAFNNGKRISLEEAKALAAGN